MIYGMNMLLIISWTMNVCRNLYKNPLTVCVKCVMTVVVHKLLITIKRIWSSMSTWNDSSKWDNGKDKLQSVMATPVCMF